MEWVEYSKKYFKEPIYDDLKAGVRVRIQQTGSIQIIEEGFSLSVSTQYQAPHIIHRRYSIEQHQDPPHNFPHVQFKFATEEIGKFRVRFDIKDKNEYNQVILGFIYKIKGVIEDLEKFKKGITEEIMVLDLVDELKSESEFLIKKLNEGIRKYLVEFDSRRITPNSFDRLKQNPLLLDFLGKDNLPLIEKAYAEVLKK